MAGPPDPDEVLPDGVQPHMRQPLLDWLTDNRIGPDGLIIWPVLAQMLKIDYAGRSAYDAIGSHVDADSDLLLDLVESCALLDRVRRP